MGPELTMIGSLPPLAADPEESLRKAVELQRSHGLGLLTDGEQRGDILSMYAGFPGIRESGGVPRVVGRIRPLDEPAAFEKVRDLDFLRTTYPEVRFKVGLTGPASFLLACASARGSSPYRGPLDPAMHDDLTEAVRPIARELSRRGAYVQIDEPVLSQGMKDYAPALRRIDAIAAEVPRGAVSLHVCGGLVRSRALDALFRLKAVSTISLAFAGRMESENRGLLEPKPWEQYGLSLGAGCVDVQVSSRDQIMRPQAVADLLRDISARAGAEHVRFALPDCGFRGTPSDLVPELLMSLERGFRAAFSNPP